MSAEGGRVDASVVTRWLSLKLPIILWIPRGGATVTNMVSIVKCAVKSR